MSGHNSFEGNVATPRSGVAEKCAECRTDCIKTKEPRSGSVIWLGRCRSQGLFEETKQKAGDSELRSAQIFKERGGMSGEIEGCGLSFSWSTKGNSLLFSPCGKSDSAEPHEDSALPNPPAKHRKQPFWVTCEEATLCFTPCWRHYCQLVLEENISSTTKP